MPRPFTRAQAAQNSRFLKALGRTGNVRLAAREFGFNRSTFIKRRARCAVFAARWEATLAAADRRLGLAGEPGFPDADAGANEAAPPLRTAGREEMVVRAASGRLQLRRAPPGRMTGEAWELFLDTLEETNNLRLAAAAAGVAHSSIIARARTNRAAARDIATARAWAGQHLERLLHASAALPPVDYDDGWQEPGITLAQALRALGAPPVKLPCTPFPARKTGKR
jgi:hypothetical protein